MDAINSHNIRKELIGIYSLLQNPLWNELKHFLVFWVRCVHHIKDMLHIGPALGGTRY